MPTDYDIVGYPSMAYLETHPARLEAVAALHGMSPPPVATARILEIGSFDGANLIPLAFELPNAEILGFDLAEEPIVHGNKTIEQLGLTNLKLRQQDLMDFDPAAEGLWDYIIVHGLYAWVPPVVRDRILEVCRKSLSPHGVAFISFNAYPGSHLRDMVRGALSFHVEQVKDPRERVEAARDFSRFMAANGDDQTRFRAIMWGEFKDLATRSPQVIFHDELAPEHHPYFFHEFAANVEAHGLQYLSEAQFFENQYRWWSDDVVAFLDKVEEEQGFVHREQYMDFLENRRFRLSLVVQGEVPLVRTIGPEGLQHMYLGSSLRPDDSEADLAPGVNVEFKGIGDIAIETDSPVAKAALLHLQASWPQLIHFDELRRRARGLIDAVFEPGTPGIVSNAEDASSLTRLFSHMYLSGLIEVRSHPPRLVARPGDLPTASPIARLQAREGDAVTTLHHQSISLDDEVGRNLLLLLDGTRDRAAILADLIAYLRSKPEYAEMNLDVLADRIEPNLLNLAKLGLLVA